MQRKPPRLPPNEPDFGHQGIDSLDELVRCAFSTTRELTIGTGTTKRKQDSKILWMVEQQAEDAYAVRKINSQFVPVGEETIITGDKLFREFTPEVEIHLTKVEPAMVKLHRTLERGDLHRLVGERDEAELEYSSALEIDELNVRAIFGLGIVLAQRGAKRRAKAVFRDIVKLDAAFNEEHKHLFNEFGISLRKAKLFDEAVQYYTRAMELTESDDHLHYNMARVHYELGQWGECADHLDHSLRLNGELEEAVMLCKLILAMHLDRKVLDKYGKPPIPDEVGKLVDELIKDGSRT
ncbi:tetratricopeptide repeat protein [Salidesulfovibrio brasiliensis]|uniref:hypothetical protein n=1 Tax=Salidesulfovibrio brasiliensis TaxID=221711 RepID=UPI0006D05C61|nr:hypothetical protein [Salidesulfovibrio brasiliensis]